MCEGSGFKRRVRDRWSSLPLRTKFAVSALLVLSLMMLTLIVMVERRQRETIIEEVRKRGVVLANDLAAVSANALLLYNYTALEQNVERFGREADVVYAVVLDMEGKVAAFSRQAGRVGSTLVEPIDLKAAATTDLLVQETMEEGQALYDIAVPIFVEGTPRKWGTVRIGLSKRRMEREIAKTRRDLIVLAGVILLLGGLASALMANRIVRPVRRLADAAQAITRGDLDQKIEAVTLDEIGALTVTFNHMAATLFQQRAELEAAHVELKARFEELSDLKGYTDNILGSLTNGILTLDLGGRIVTMNPAAEHLTASSREILGRHAAEVFAVAPDLVSVLMETLSTSVARTIPLIMLSSADGSSVPLEVVTAPLRGSDGKALGVVGVLRDLTTIYQLEEQLRRADRLAAVGTLAAGLAHEIKNPLVSVRAYTQLLQEKFTDERFRKTYREVVLPELDRINGIIEGLLDLSRPARLKFERVSLADLLDKTIALYSGRLEEKRITIVRDFAPELPAVKADPDHLYRAFGNLVSNALESMEDGGRLTLRTAGLSEIPPTAQAFHGGSGPWVLVEIEDTGTGIEPLNSEKVFNPFFTTKKRGTGLGLALTHKIIEDHQGQITVRSSPGVGTTFTVILAVAPPGVQPKASITALPRAGQRLGAFPRSKGQAGSA